MAVDAHFCFRGLWEDEMFARQLPSQVKYLYMYEVKDDHKVTLHVRKKKACSLHACETVFSISAQESRLDSTHRTQDRQGLGKARGR